MNKKWTARIASFTIFLALSLNFIEFFHAAPDSCSRGGSCEILFSGTDAESSSSFHAASGHDEDTCQICLFNHINNSQCHAPVSTEGIFRSGITTGEPVTRWREIHIDGSNSRAPPFTA